MEDGGVRYQLKDGGLDLDDFKTRCSITVVAMHAVHLQVVGALSSLIVGPLQARQRFLISGIDTVSMPES
jgi:hypothetical protein